MPEDVLAASPSSPTPPQPNALGLELKRLYEMGNHEELAAVCQRALAQEPQRGELWKVLGVALAALGQLDAALAAKQRAAQALPQDLEAQLNLANTAMRLERWPLALSVLRQACRLAPQSGHSWALLARSLAATGQTTTAERSWERAIGTDPQNVGWIIELGNLLEQVGRPDQAIDWYRHALDLQPDLAVAWNNLGNALVQKGQAHAALEAFNRALEGLPGRAEVVSNRGNLFKEWGRLREAQVDYESALALDPHFPGARTNLLLVENHLLQATPGATLTQARRFGMFAQAHAGPPLRPVSPTSLTAGRRMRVGVIRGDLRQHPVGYFARALFDFLPREGVDLLVYATLAHEDALSQRLRQGARTWHTLPGDEAMAARQIADDGLDVLLDLAGHTAHNGLNVMAWRPAPVQATWLGYFATTGLPTMDWLIADAWSVPPEDEVRFSERIARLPETRLCYTPPDKAPEVAPAPSHDGKPFCFASFQPFGKYNKSVLDLWAQTLLAVPGSVLRLQQAFFANPRVCEDMRASFQSRGVAPERLRLHGKKSLQDYLRAYSEVDIVLDTFPYPGGTTTCEALWMGVPTLTFSGTTLLSRQGSGLMRAAGLGDWVAADRADRLSKARHWSQHTDLLAAMRAGLRDRLVRTALMDGERFAKGFAGVLRGMVEQG